MAKVIREGVGAFTYPPPKVAVIVTAHAKGKDNAMTVAWHTSISSSPPLYGVAISPKRFTYQLIIDSKEFGVNFLPFDRVELVAYVGGVSGQEVDKFQRFNIARDKAKETAVPILKDAYAAYECKLVEDRGYGDYRLLIGEVAAVHWLKEAYTPDKTVDLDKINPIVYLGYHFYTTLLKATVKHVEIE